jgi:hypothetical protein
VGFSVDILPGECWRCSLSNLAFQLSDLLAVLESDLYDATSLLNPPRFEFTTELSDTNVHLLLYGSASSLRR